MPQLGTTLFPSLPDKAHVFLQCWLAFVCCPGVFRRILVPVRMIVSHVLFMLIFAGCASNRAPEQAPSNRIFESPDVDSLHWLEEFRPALRKQADPGRSDELPDRR